MDTLDKDCAAGFLESCHPPCLSVYQPTHRHNPGKQQDPIKFERLVDKLEASLLRQLPEDEVRPLLEPFLALAADGEFWHRTRDGLAVLGATGLFRTYKLQRPVAEVAVVANRLHLKPLLRVLQSADRYQVLGLNRQAIRFFEGNRDALDEIEPCRNIPRTITEVLGEEWTDGGKAPEADHDAQHFFRAVDRGIWEHYSQPSGLPLLLAALPEHQQIFHQVSKNPFLLPESIDSHPDDLHWLGVLHQKAWQLIEPRYLARLAALGDQFGEARAKGRGDDDLAQVAKAVVGGGAATLLIESCRAAPGRLDAATGEILVGDLAQPGVDDVLDDLGSLTLQRGGDVVVVPAEQMPTATGIAAIYRH